MTKHRLTRWMRWRMYWHTFVTGHTQFHVNTWLSVPSFDPGARGHYVVCKQPVLSDIPCNKEWVQ